MPACDPTHFTPFIAEMEKWSVPITLLHDWPFLKEAQWLSEVFENVYYDAGVILNYGAAESERILQEALQIGKFQKFLSRRRLRPLRGLLSRRPPLPPRALRHPRPLDRRRLPRRQGVRRDRDAVCDENARRIYPKG